MIEYQGWVVIRESYDEKNESDELLKMIWNRLKIIVGRINTSRKVEICHLKVVNGDYKLIIAGFDSRKSESWQDILDLFNWISKEAIGSYGLLHFFDEQNNRGLNNHFQVLVLKKGKISFEVDRFLSPFIPEVEDNI